VVLPAIAAALGRHGSTVWREIRRNRTARERYEGHHADCEALTRRSCSRRNQRLTAEDWACVRACLEQDWSPEQIASRLGAAGVFQISHASIYVRLHRERHTALSLWGHLRQNRRQWRRRRGGSRRPRLRGRSIHERPATVETRQAIGHWELDTVVGRGGRNCILTAVERATGFVAIGKLRVPTAAAFARRAIQLLRGQAHPIKTVTIDIGPEMSDYRRIEAALQTTCYFTDPYSAWQRGTNENPNGLIRQYLPKGTSMAHVTQYRCTHIAARLNERPRKRLQWFAPEECYGT
jgi:IS30 family transposase